MVCQGDVAANDLALILIPASLHPLLQFAPSGLVQPDDEVGALLAGDDLGQLGGRRSSDRTRVHRHVRALDCRR